MSSSLGFQGLWPARLLCPWDFPVRNTGVGCHFLLQEIFPTQGLNPGLPHCRQMLYHLSHQGSCRCNLAHFPLIFSASSPVLAPVNFFPRSNLGCKIVTSSLFLSVSRDKLSDHFYAKNCPASHLRKQIQEHRAWPSWILVLCFCSWNW